MQTLQQPFKRWKALLANMPKLAVYALTPQGLQLAMRIRQHFLCTIFAAVSLQKEYMGCVDNMYTGAGEQSPPCVSFLGQAACAPKTAACDDATAKTVRADESSTDQHSVVFFHALKQCVADNYHQFSGHIFIAATGIVVRCMAPLLGGKQHDPAVLVCDQQGQFVISLIAGHLGGANALAKQLAGVLGATPVITTATDVAGLPSFDMLAKQHGLHIGTIGSVKFCNAALLRGETVTVVDQARLFGDTIVGIEYASCVATPQPSTVIIDYHTQPHACSGLYLYPPVLYAGVGCKRGTPAQEIEEAILQTLANNNLSHYSLVAISSFEAKATETGILATAQRLGVGTYFFSQSQLAQFPACSVSPKALETFGVKAVCEPAALAAAHRVPSVAVAHMCGKLGDVGIDDAQRTALQNGMDDNRFALYNTQSLLVKKTKYARVTVAVALCAWYINRVKGFA